MVCQKSFSDKFGILVQGVGNWVSGSNTIFFIPKSQVPQDRTVAYVIIVCGIKPHKAKTHRTILNVAGNITYWPGEVPTPTAYITTAKTLINNTISTPDTRFVCADIANFYLNTPIYHYKYIQLTFDIIPQDIIYEYNLTDISHNGKVYIHIINGMYGLPQSGIIAHDRFKNHPEKHGYQPVKLAPGICTQKRITIYFTLIVDDFVINYVVKKHADHIIQALQ